MVGFMRARGSRDDVEQAVASRRSISRICRRNARLTPFFSPSCVRRGLSGPHDAGHYNSSSWETGFFVSQGGSWSTPYGHFFLSWYSGLLSEHANRILTRASEILNRTGRPRLFKAAKEVRFVRDGGCSADIRCSL